MNTAIAIPKAGLPDNVELFHPIQYVGLNKVTLAYLEMGLESYKGGVTHQLLVGHVVRFVSERGVDALRLFSNYKEEYMSEIIRKFSEKGMDLFSLSGQKVPINVRKLTLLSDDKTAIQTEDGFTRTANIYSSSNYKMFHFLPFNRTISRTHVRDLVESIKENGVLSHPLMIHTDCIDGQMKYWIVDGQHRFKAFEVLGLPVHFTLYRKRASEQSTKRDIVKLVARVNNTSRKWNIHQYLRAWSSLNAEDYKVIKDDYDKTKIAINTLLQAYSGEDRRIATKKFVNGVYQITDRQNGTSHIARLVELKGLIPKNTSLQSALLDLFRKYPDYNNDVMKEKLRNTRGKYVYGETQEEILANLDKLYNS